MVRLREIVKDREENQRMENKNAAKRLVMIGMFVAVLAVMSQLSIPLPSGVPVTMQTFAVALTAYVLGAGMGVWVMAAYLLLGVAGVPVFANFGAGLGVVFGPAGGFFWGFFCMIVLCGIGVKQKNRALLVVLSAAGLGLCHLIGVLQFMAVMDRGFGEAFVMVSLPYLLKDAVSLAAAYTVAVAVRRALLKIA